MVAVDPFDGVRACAEVASCIPDRRASLQHPSDCRMLERVRRHVREIQRDPVFRGEILRDRSRPRPAFADIPDPVAFMVLNDEAPALRGLDAQISEILAGQAGRRLPLLGFLLPLRLAVEDAPNGIHMAAIGRRGVEVQGQNIPRS